MAKMGGERIKQLSAQKQSRADEVKVVDFDTQQPISKFLISPMSYWNMQWNNFTQFAFLTYIIIMPLLISMNVNLVDSHIMILLSFDIIFMTDRVADLFVGFYLPNGLQEHRLTHVMWENISTKFFIEVFIIGTPLIL